MDGNIERYFLGANTPTGFTSLYDGFVSAEAGDFLHILKGGPGCGKSSFMEKLGAAAEAQGLGVEYIYCSGDPDSLDGVYVPKKRVAYVDGTAPHVIEPRFAAACEDYVNLGEYYDSVALRGRMEEIMTINRAYKESYRRAYAYLAAYGAAYDTLDSDAVYRTALRRADSAIRRELGKGKGLGHEKRRFISAFTCKGRVFFDQTIKTLCDRIYTLDNELGGAPVFLKRMARAAVAAGYDIVSCVDPLLTDRLQALLIPEISLGFLAVNAKTPWDGEVSRHVRLDAAVDRETLRAERARLRSNVKLRTALLDGAETALVRAKSLHDELEMIYNPHVDFNGVYAKAEEHIAAL